MRLRPAATAAVAALLAGTACIDPIKPENAIYIEFALNRTDFAAGDSLYVTSRAVNTIGDPVQLERPCGRVFEVQVHSSTGQVVFNSSAVSAECATDAPSVTLPGDGEVSETYARAGLVASDGTPLPPGQYLVDAVIRPAGRQRRANGVVVTVK